MVEGTAQPSMATLALERQAEFGLTDLETAYTLAGPWDAGVGTVSMAVTINIERVCELTLMYISQTVISIEIFLRTQRPLFIDATQ